MTEVLSPEWFEAANAALEGLSEGPGGSGVVELVVTGGDEGRVAVHWVIEDGRLRAVRPAAESGVEAEVSAPQARQDLEEMVAGRYDPAVAFMRGDLKPDGSARAFLAWLSALARDDCRAALSA